MTPPSPPASAGASRPPASSPSRLLLIGVLVSLAGVALAASLSWLHLQIEASGGAYTSFCNVNESINCDRVLSSSFAKMFGVPIANLGLFAYLALTVVLVAAFRARGAAQAGLLRWAALGAVGAVVFSAYMAAVSLFVLGTICLMCSGLYTVAIVLLIVTIAAGRRIASSTGEPPLDAAGAGAASLAAIAVAVLAAVVSWPGAPAATLTAEQIRSEEPQFDDWFTSLPVSRVSVPGGRGNTIGPDEAPVTIVEFFDFECGHCKQNHARLESLLERRPDDVRVVYRHFPLDPSCNEVVPEPIHVRACRAAEAAECAGRQGKFAEMADAMFERQTQLFETNLPRIAGVAGLDIAAFSRCMEEHAALNDVIADCRAGADLDLRSTPTMFFNGRRVEGAINQEGGYDYAVTLEADAASSDPGPRGS